MKLFMPFLISFLFTASSFCQVYELEQIFVSAKKCKKEWEVEYTTGVVKGESVQREGSLPASLGKIPGVRTKDYHGLQPTESVDLRGFYGGMTKHYLLLLDGVCMNERSTKLIDFSSIPHSCIERVEVLKGASSFLFGENALVGALNIITKGKGKSLILSAGSYGTRNILLSCPLGISSFFLDAKSTDGYRKGTGSKDIKALLKFQIKGVSLLIKGRRLWRGAHPWPISESALADDRRANREGTEDDEGQKEEWDAILSYKSVQAWRRRMKEHSIYYKKRLKKQEDVLGLNAKTESSFKGCNLLYGVEGEWTDFFEEKEGEKQDVEAREGAFYAQMEYPVKSFILGLGARWDTFHFTYSKKGEKKEKDESSPSYKLSLMKKGSSTYYITFSTAFRVPTMGQLFTYKTANIGLRPEKASNIEFGIKGEKFSFALYKMRIKDKILYDYKEKIYRNIGKASLKGLELYSTIPLGRRLYATFSYSFNHTEDERTGLLLPNIAPHTLYLSLNYEESVQVDMHYTSSFFIDKKNKHSIPSSFVVDAIFAFPLLGKSASVKIKNLFDEEYSLYGYEKGGVLYLQPAPTCTIFFDLKLF